jgi:hypothetical protein
MQSGYLPESLRGSLAPQAACNFRRNGGAVYHWEVLIMSRTVGDEACTEAVRSGGGASRSANALESEHS